MNIISLNMAMLYNFVTLFVSDVNGLLKLGKIENTLDHFFEVTEKFRRDLSLMEYRLDKIENATLSSEKGNIQSLSGVGIFSQPVKVAREKQWNECEGRTDLGIMKKIMHMVLDSLSKEKQMLRDVLKDFDARITNVEIRNEKRLRDLENKTIGQQAHINIPAYTKEVVEDYTYSSCAEVHETLTDPESGIFYLKNEEGEAYKVYCDFYPTHIYTYIAPTCLTSLDVSSLYNNQHEVLIRHRLNDGSQLEAKIEQISDYKMQDLSVQYNQNVGYNSILNSQMGPYLYLGFLPIAGITHLGDTQGYSVNGIDYTFTNCDGNPNSYFVLLFNKNGANFTSAGGANLFMTRWKDEAVVVAPENELPDHFFSQFEMHMGGCGGFMTSDALSDLFGVTIGLRYDFTYSSCAEISNTVTNPESGIFFLENDEGAKFKVYCDFYPTHIYTYIAPTCLASLDVSSLYNNQHEVLIRHRLNDGSQLEAKIEQISDYKMQDLSVQYNQNVGYNNIINSQMGPYLYLGFLPIAGITHLGDTQGYSVNGIDYTFTNCDGNPNSYFVLLFNKNEANFTSAGGANLFMTRWKDEAVAVAPENELPDHFFSQFEMHMGGCGGFMTSDALSDLFGVTIGLRFDM